MKFLVGRTFSQTPKIQAISTDFIFTDKVYTVYRTNDMDFDPPDVGWLFTKIRMSIRSSPRKGEMVTRWPGSTQNQVMEFHRFFQLFSREKINFHQNYGFYETYAIFILQLHLYQQASDLEPSSGSHDSSYTLFLK